MRLFFCRFASFVGGPGYGGTILIFLSRRFWGGNVSFPDQGHGRFFFIRPLRVTFVTLSRLPNGAVHNGRTRFFQLQHFVASRYSRPTRLMKDRYRTNFFFCFAWRTILQSFHTFYVSTCAGPLIFISIILLFNTIRRRMFSIFFCMARNYRFRKVFLIVSRVYSVYSVVAGFTPFFRSGVSCFTPFLVCLFSFFTPFLGSDQIVILV